MKRADIRVVSFLHEIAKTNVVSAMFICALGSECDRNGFLPFIIQIEDSAMKRLLSRSGSTFAQVLRISLLLGLSFAVVEAQGFAQSVETAEPALNQHLTLVTPSEASLHENSSSPATAPPLPSRPPDITLASLSEEPPTIAKILLASMEAKINHFQALTGTGQPAAPLDNGGDAAPDFAFVSQKIAALDRMIKLLEQKQTMQAVAGIYQKRLDDMLRKIEKGSNPSRLE